MLVHSQGFVVSPSSLPSHINTHLQTYTILHTTPKEMDLRIVYKYKIKHTRTHILRNTHAHKNLNTHIYKGQQLRKVK